MPRANSKAVRRGIAKSPTGIQGLDEVTGGGLPRGRVTLVCGKAGCGKSLLAMEFLVHGAVLYGEPGVCMDFEETEEKLASNVASLGFDLPALAKAKKVLVDYVSVERSRITETGDYNLEGLFVRLEHAVKTINAKRVVLDSIEALFSELSDTRLLRAELRRLFRWLEDRKLTAVVTGEAGERTLTRHGLEEYIADCVISLDHRVTEQISTRRMRIVKYRGTAHGTDEFPFLIDSDGISVVPITSLALAHKASSERVSTGIPVLDEMMEGKGFFRGSSVLVSGTAGTGKSSLAASFTRAACARGEHCLYFAFEESPGQILRNMRSVGIDLERWVKKGLLHFHAMRPTSTGLEGHLSSVHKLIGQFRPSVVVVDPITNMIAASGSHDVKSMLMRLVDFLKVKQITSIFTNLTLGGDPLQKTAATVSSLMDTWIILRDSKPNGTPRRELYVLKSRGMAHSREPRELVVSRRGIELGRVRRNHPVATGIAGAEAVSGAEEGEWPK
ncbi:MAG TPA: circadian clock protein KaiC [Terriglobales bacterium]|nr:circadian clock protein KaiC [Terriglobales bacterium]